MKWPKIDFSLLKKVNPRTIGWIHLEDTPIDYPVVQGPDKEYYLSHNFSDEESVHGCIFAYGNSSFPDRRCVLYGHAMQDGTMFVKLHRYYYDDGFFETHRTIDIKTEDGNYIIRVWGAVQFPLDCLYMIRLPDAQEYFDSWTDAIRELTPFDSEFEMNLEDNIIALCTCRMPSPDGAGILMVVGRVENA